jgi:excisionase family DNA binding protein
MTINEAADYLGLAPATLRAQIGKGKIRGTKRGRDWWIVQREVDRYRIESRGQAKGAARKVKA